MMRSTIKSFIISILLLFTNTAFSQELEQIFFEGFRNNNFMWATHTGPYDTVLIENDTYHIRQNKTLSEYTVWVGCGIEETKDFEIEAKINFISATLGSYGIIWGVKNESNYGAYVISENGRFTVKYVNERSRVPRIYKSADCRFIKKPKESLNILKIRKRNDTLSFYINHGLVFSMPFVPFYGNGVGFYIDGDMNMAVESLKISAQREHMLLADTTGMSFKRVYSEHFQNNVKNWELRNDTHVTGEIKNGFYCLHNKQENISYTSRKDISLPDDKDFLIQCRTVVISGKINAGYGLCFGNTATNISYRLVVATEGYFVLFKIESNKDVIIKKWSPSTAVNMGYSAENIFTVMKKGKTLYFYINSAQVQKVNNFTGTINEVGCVIESIANVRYDYINVFVSER